MGFAGPHAPAQGVGSPRSLVGSGRRYAAASAPAVGCLFRMYEHNIDRQDVVSFVGHLLRMIRRKVVLILDRWSVHRAAVAILQKRYPDRLTIEWLPAYAPELNPTEQVWNHTKYGDLANFIPDHIEDLADAVCMSITAQHHDNNLIRGFFKYAQLEL